MFKKKKSWIFFIGLAFSLFLILSGLIMTVRVINQYEEIAVTARDDQLFGLARSVDRSVASYLRRYSENLKYTVERWMFINAESTWLEGGDETDLLLRMKDNIVLQDELIIALLATRDDAVLLSSDGKTDYVFPPLAGRQSGSEPIRPCVAGDGGVYLAFGIERENGLTYYALMDLIGFYRRVAADLTVGTDDRILLMDAGGKTLVHNTHEGIRVDTIARMDNTYCDYYGIEHLLTAQEADSEQAVFYEAYTCQGEGPFTSRIAVVPANANTNGFFVVGASTNYDEAMRPMSMAAFRLITYGSMAVIGILLLAVVALWLLRRGARTDKELAALRQKNAVMEELNRQTQELAHHQRLQTIGTLTSSIAHEFNNLLTPIMGYSLMAMEQLPDQESGLYDDLLEIYQASQKAKDIISRLSDLSRKNTALTFRYVEPDTLVHKVLEVAQPVRPARVEVETHLDCRHVWILGNEIQLSQLLLNLILNAYHAMEETGGVLSITTDMEEENVRFTVRDTGCGIPEEVLPQIFEPFFSTKETGKGTGLGLAIVRQVVEEHKGTISVESREGEGTTFVVTFPVTPPPEEPEDN